uniref:Uncharacterized protein n=1 Tax=Lactuca sativa TaxID=4236 RepID=A0A9R1UWS2_LACSA|nr:hypothetical protein LSAT_V11C800423820 [Lactuca sativa]
MFQTLHQTICCSVYRPQLEAPMFSPPTFRYTENASYYTYGANKFQSNPNFHPNPRFHHNLNFHPNSNPNTLHNPKRILSLEMTKMEKLFIQSSNAHVGIDLNDDEPYDILRPSRPMGRDKAKKKLKGVEGSTVEEKR